MVTEAVKTISQYGDFEWFVSDDPYVLDNPPWQEPDVYKRQVIIYAKTSFELAKLYAPSFLLGVASITSILASNNILRKRNVALTLSLIHI